MGGSEVERDLVPVWQMCFFYTSSAGSPLHRNTFDLEQCVTDYENCVLTRVCVCVDSHTACVCASYCASRVYSCVCPSATAGTSLGVS